MKTKKKKKPKLVYCKGKFGLQFATARRAAQASGVGLVKATTEGEERYYVPSSLTITFTRTPEEQAEIESGVHLGASQARESDYNG